MKTGYVMEELRWMELGYMAYTELGELAHKCARASRELGI